LPLGETQGKIFLGPACTKKPLLINILTATFPSNRRRGTETAEKRQKPVRLPFGNHSSYANAFPEAADRARHDHVDMIKALRAAMS